MNYALKNMDPVNIDSYEISLYSYDTMVAMAGSIEITKYKTTDIKNSDTSGLLLTDPKKMNDLGAINDMRMGTMSLTDKCVTCTGFDCPGHWGIMMFGKDNEIINPLYTRQVIMILNCVCHDCSRLLFAKELENGGINMTNGLSQIIKKTPEQRLQLLEKYCAKIKECDFKYPKELNVMKCKPHRKLKASDIKDDGVVQYYQSDDKKKSKNETSKAKHVYTLYNNKILNILKNITTEDAKILGFVGNTAPVDLIMRAILVMPPLTRPPTTNKKGELINNPFTTMYIDILKAINNDKANAPGRIFKTVKALLLKNDTKTGANQKIKSIGESLQGKKGIYRSMIMGKRSDFNGRSVAGPGHSLRLNEMVLPNYWAYILTKNLKVTSFNIDVLTILLKDGKITHIQSLKGFRKPYDSSTEYQLKIGETVDIVLEPGDRIYANRQPSLSKYSMFSFKILFSNDLVIRSHLSITQPTNLDYDGDELNIWSPRNFQVLAEQQYLLDVTNCFISTETATPTMGLLINSRNAGYLLSMQNREIEESLYDDMIATLSNTDALPTLYERMESLGITPYRTDELTGARYYLGKTALSALFPKDFEYTAKGIVIYKGVIISGVLSSSHLGSSSRSIVDDLVKFYSKERAADFLSDAPHLLTVWIKAYGFTVGIKDCVNMVTDSKCEIYNKKYNKRGRIYEYEFNNLKNIVFSKKSFDDLQTLYNNIIIIINKTTTNNLNDNFIKYINQQAEQLNTIINVYKPNGKYSQFLYKEQIINILKNLGKIKNNFKDVIKTILDNLTSIFKIIINTKKVTDNFYILLKSITHRLEESYILSGTNLNLDYFYNDIIIDNNIEELNNFDSYIINIYNIAKDVDYDIKLINVIDVIDKLNTNYISNINSLLNEIITILKNLNNHSYVDVVSFINNTILAAFNESLLIITSIMYTNLKEELNKEYNKNILVKNEELDKIYLDIENLGSVKDVNPGSLLHHERLIIEKTDIVKAIGAKIAKSVTTNSIINQTEVGSGAKGSIMNVGQIMGSVGQQYVGGKRLWSDFSRLSSHFDYDDESPKARGLVESSFFEGLSPTELFFVQGAARENIIDTAMLTPLVGKLQRLLARSLENLIIAGDGSIRNANGLMYSPSYNSGYDITRLIKTGTIEQPNLQTVIDIEKIINISNHNNGWYTTNELKNINIPVKKISLEDRFNALKQKPKETPTIIKSTQPYQQKLSIYEKAKIIGYRAEMLNNNTPPRIDIGNLIDPLKIAQLEYEQGKLADAPALFIQRKIPGKPTQNVYPTLNNI